MTFYSQFIARNVSVYSRFIASAARGKFLLDRMQNSSEEIDIIHSTCIGIIGGGQLGLMLSEAARALGYAAVTVLDPMPQCPASVMADQIQGSLKDPA